MEKNEKTGINFRLVYIYILFDLRKAFDAVSHGDILYSRGIYMCGLRGDPL